MGQRNNRMLRDFIVLSGGELLSKIAGFVAFAYLARVLDPQAYGAVELAVALAVVFTLFIDFGIGPVGVRAVSRDRSTASVYARRIPSVRILLMLGAIPLMSGTVVVMGQPNETMQLVWLFALGLVAAPWNQRWLFQGLEMMGWVSIGQVVRMTVFMAGVILWVRETSDLLRIGVIEIVAAAAMAFYFLLIQNIKITPVRLDFSVEKLKRLVQESYPIGLAQIVQALNLYLPVVLIGVLADGEEIAWFGAANRIAISIATFNMIYHFNLFPTISRCLGISHDAFYAVVKPSFRVAAWGGIFIAFAGSLFAGPVSRIIYGEAFTAAALPLAILIWVIPIHLLSGHARWALIAGDRQHWVLLAQLSGVTVSIVSGLVLIPEFGAVGASIAAVMASFTIWVVAHICVLIYIGRIPFMGVVIRPLLFVVAGFGVLSFRIETGWLAAIAVCFGFVMFAPLVDSKLIRDFMSISSAKTDTQDTQLERGIEL